MIREARWDVRITYEGLGTSDEEYIVGEVGHKELTNNVNDSDQFLVFSDIDGDVRMIKKSLIQRIALTKEV